jgi:nitric oxide reductase NorD protein
VEEWIIETLDIYDRKGLYPACAILRNPQQFAAELDQKEAGLALEDVVGVLEHFIHGLSGRNLKLAAGDEAYTDTETLFLPARLSVFEREQDNFILFKAMAVHQWAQTWYGTFRETVSERCAEYHDTDKALRLFHALETVRLNACIAAEFAGLAREREQLQNQFAAIEYPANWEPYLQGLRHAHATASDSWRAVRELYDASGTPPAYCYQGGLDPKQVDKVMSARLLQEKEQMRRMVGQMMEEHPVGENAATEQGEDGPDQGSRFQVAAQAHPDRPEELVFELRIDGQPVTPPAGAHTLLSSIMQDLGEIPEGYLVAAGDGGYSQQATPEKRAEDVWKGAYHEEGALLYKEWDYRRKAYRKNWCVLREIDVHPQDAGFVSDTLRKHAGVVGYLRKTFEMLRGEDKLLKKQKNGEDIDVDALVEAIADSQCGMEMSERLFTRQRKLERNIAVMFMVDMSASTKGWINDAERESLVLLCEALEVLGDRYAIYGFSGMTRKRCELFRIKRFDEPYSELVKARVSGIRPQDYTRMGVTIRHLTRLLHEVNARTKLLVALSDGKPDDYDGYRGEYGIEDTRQALIEARREGVHPFCITIDTEARDYLPHMYGAVNYALVDEVRKLPQRVSEIYRKITT